MYEQFFTVQMVKRKNETRITFLSSIYRISRTTRHTLIFSFDFLEKNNDECILILVIYWKKTGLVHTKLATII